MAGGEQTKTIIADRDAKASRADIDEVTKHGGVVDAKAARHRVTSTYVSAKPNQEKGQTTVREGFQFSDMEGGTHRRVGPRFWSSGRGPVIWK